MVKAQKQMVTSALPYGNGPLHLGHMVEHIMTNIWQRSQLLMGHECLSICGDDAHGTPIMLKANELGISPEELTAEVQIGHQQDLHDFSVDYDVYHSTHSAENQTLVELIYAKLQANQDILSTKISQAYDIKAQMFLPDRFIKGDCPRCKASDQYGDNCEKCGATYDAHELLNPRSTLSQTTPEYRETEHFFFNLPKYSDFLQAWTTSGRIPLEMSHKLAEWFEQGLKPWDISRDAPYFGFQIPGLVDKYFYVWMDAPIGYIAATLKYCEQHQLDWMSLWGADSEYELYHVVGKDIMYFHALFWPAVLKSAGFRLPNAIFTHGFLTINGQKMSKSRGTFIQARQYLDFFPSDCLRYYFACKMNGGLEDLDLQAQDFITRVNADLIGKLVNIASRCSGFVHKYFEGQLAPHCDDIALYHAWSAAREEIILAYQQRDNAKAMRLIMAVADKINQYIDLYKPWSMAKDEALLPKVAEVCTLALNGFRLLMLLLQPVLPNMVKQVQIFFNDFAWSWHPEVFQPLLQHKIAAYQPLLERLKAETWEAMVAAGAR